ncbi:hypothetical protein AAVH_24483 [Aphelenchoides avenae]|nr:hypothetical protein AAVH_24483 [Aphelenchus avenae]
MAYDVVSIGTLTVRTVNIAVVSDLGGAVPLARWPSDGILGFARQHFGLPGFDSSIVGLARSAGAPIVSLFAGDASKNQAGVLTLGGADPRNCYSNWTRLAQTKGNETDIWSWSVKVNR